MKEKQRWILRHRDPFIEDLKKLVSIPSVLQEDDSPYPFGMPVQRALEAMLDIAGRLGFRTFIDPDGYYGYAEIGTGSEMVGVLGHVDVVPAGDLSKWRTQPFDAVQSGDILYGRGTQDDKGPTLAALYAAKALCDMDLPFNKRIRFIFGTDEETLWRGIQAYEKKEDMPDLGFSPDSKFPLIFAEKGLKQVHLIAPAQTPIRLSCGDAFNSVPSSAYYEGPYTFAVQQALQDLNYSFKPERDGIRVLGKSVHAQVVEEGVNAVTRLCKGLHAAGADTPAIRFIAELLNGSPFGDRIFGAVEDQVSGKLKCTVGKLKMDETQEVISMDLRVPVSADVDVLMEKLRKTASAYGLTVEDHDYLRSIHVPQNAPLIQCLMGAYQKVTGDLTSQPVSSGGATYARAMDNCVAFGAVLPGRQKTEHQPDEHIVIGDMLTAMEIYAEALEALLLIDLDEAKEDL